LGKLSLKEFPIFKLLRTLRFRTYSDPCIDDAMFPHERFPGSVDSLQANVSTNTNYYGLLTIHHDITLGCALDAKEKSMSTILVIILILLLVGALPSWPYSNGWGYYPSGGLGLVLLVVLVLALSGRL
jgi:hypothetical protein